MTLQIRAISVYSRNGQRRDVCFRLGALNIVTGASKTGKSALLDIVDYCWGRDECTVAEGEIRRAASWFAVHLDKGGEGILIARKSPGPAGRTSDEIYFERGAEALPANADGFYKNITASGLRTQLSLTLGISENVNVPREGASRQPLEASSGHAIVFSLQAQDEIANRRLLFHRQGEQFFPQAIRDSIPYFLGAVDEGHFLSLRRLQDAKGRLRRWERELEETRSITQGATVAARALLREAKAAQLLPAAPEPESAEDVLGFLRSAVVPQPYVFSQLDDPQADLTVLDEQRRNLIQRLSDLREEISDVDRLDREAIAFEGEAREQQARLASIGLIGDGDGDTNSCPLCESRLHVPVPTVDEIRSSLLNLQLQLGSVRRDAPRLQERRANLDAQRADLSAKLRGVQADIGKRIQDNERLRLEQHQFVEQARVAGRIAYYLENVRAVSADSDLPRKVEQTRAEVEELQRATDDDAAHERLVTALNLVGKDLTDYASELGLEHGTHALRLDTKHLTVVADTDDGPLALAQMGSGENWVGYHIALHLSLHRVFRRRTRPVPAFLILDQPSQAHYPPERDRDGRIDGLGDEDQAAVRKLFALLNDYCAKNTDMQIIVADHVELLDGWFKTAIVERWRGGAALIPASWFAD